MSEPTAAEVAAEVARRLMGEPDEGRRWEHTTGQEQEGAR